MTRITLILAACLAMTQPAFSAETVSIDPPAEGSVTPEQGLDAWARVCEVTSHPRCKPLTMSLWRNPTARP